VSRPSRHALATLAAAALLAGCGGDGDDDTPDSERVTNAVTDYAHAFGAGDGDRACSLLTPAARSAFTARVSSLVGTRDCAEAVGKLQSVAGPNVTGPFSEATVDGVEVTGEKATARVKAGGATEEVSLEKRDGEWLLTKAPGT
jgi:hypothetical protein